MRDPFPGWLDNLYGAFGIWAAVFKGVLRIAYGDPDVALSYTPVDWAIRGMLVSAWAKATGLRTSDQDDTVEVLNMEGSKFDRQTYRKQIGLMPNYLKYMSNAIRYPRYYMGTNYQRYWFSFMLSHIPYALLIDTLLKLSGQKPRLLPIYRKIFQANAALAYFMANEFPIVSDKIDKLEKLVPQRDSKQFSCALGPESPLSYDRHTYFKNTISGISKYVFKEDMSIEKNKNHLKKLLILEVLTYFVLACFLYWTIFKGTLHRFIHIFS